MIPSRQHMKGDMGDALRGRIKKAVMLVKSSGSVLDVNKTILGLVEHDHACEALHDDIALALVKEASHLQVACEFRALEP